MKFNWKKITLRIFDGIDTFLWFTVGLIGGAWVVAERPDMLATMRQDGGQIFIFWFVVMILFGLIAQGVEWLWDRRDRKVSTQNDSSRA